MDRVTALYNIPTRHGYPKGTAVTWMYAWAFQIFLNTADRELLLRMFPLSPTVIMIIVVMILRVYAMWNRSKRILYLLLLIYVPQVIVSVVFAGLYNTTTYLSGMSRTLMCCCDLTQVSIHILRPFHPVTVVRIMHFSFCNPSWSNTLFAIDMFDEIPRFALSAILLILAVTQTLK